MLPNLSCLNYFMDQNFKVQIMYTKAILNTFTPHLLCFLLLLEQNLS